ncbi:MAG: uroporphyrinogen-III synthase [Gemmatimonadota bacterium]
MTRSLAGLRIAVTRAADQAAELALPLRERGAEVIITPLIRIVPSLEAAEVRAAAARVARYDWIVFTSANGAHAFAAALRGAGIDRWPPNVALACVGPATAAAAREHGFEPALIPEEYTGDAIAEALLERADLRGRRVLLARAGGARQTLPERLRQAGARVQDLALYRSEADPEGSRRLRQAIAAEALDLITFTSGSAVRYFVESMGGAVPVPVAVIGPVTADEARQRKLDVRIEAEPHTIAGLVSAIERYFAARAADRGEA